VPLTANQPRLIFRLDTQPQHNNSRANTAHRPLPRCLLGRQRFLLSGPWGRRSVVMTAVENASACTSAGRRCGAHHLRRVGKCGKGSRSPLSTTEGVSLCFSTRIAFNEEIDAGEFSRTLAIEPYSVIWNKGWTSIRGCARRRTCLSTTLQSGVSDDQSKLSKQMPPRSFAMRLTQTLARWRKDGLETEPFRVNDYRLFESLNRAGRGFPECGCLG